MNTAHHEPALLAEVLEAIRPRAGGLYLDATVGLGGHAEAILDRSAPTGTLLGLDRDPDAVAFARERLARFGDRTVVAHAAFGSLGDVLRERGIAALSGALMDVGMSSYQLDSSGRGFSFRSDEPLDMRMDPTTGETAADTLRKSPAATLEYVFRVYGEERYARRIAEAIVAARRSEPLRTTNDLARLVERVVPAPSPKLRHRIHPATRVFQALRIAVNDELRQLESGLADALNALEVGAALAVISFHSLEDRIVKRAFRGAARDGDGFELVTKKPLIPSDEERERNPRSRSAKLRVIRRAIPSNSP